jgi:hypothetical protein
MEAFLAALAGGVLTIAGGLAAVLVTGRGVKSQWRRDTQLKVGTEVLSALQKRVSAINDLAYLADKKGDEGKKAWDVECTAATEFNNARHAALLVSPPEVAGLLQDLDDQTDSLLGRAMAKQWTLEEFRRERDTLGRLAANYVDAVRATAGWSPLQLKSLWMWDKTEGLPTSPQTAVQIVDHHPGSS